nr:alpha/beta hydrolase [Actibacterium sp. 188UL27-1]
MSKLLITATALVGITAGCGVYVDQRADRAERVAEQAYPPEGQLLTVGTTTIHAVIQGSGPDLVLIHGASGNTRDFTFDLMGRMANRYRVIVLDRPGFGWSAALPRKDGTIFDQAAVLQSAAAQLGAEKPIVLGHSYGGAVALAWATTRPDNIAALVTTAAASQVWEGGIDPLYRVTGTRLGGATVVPVITAFVSDERVDTAVKGIFAPQAAPDGYITHVGSGLSLRRETLRVNARERRSLKGEIRQMVPQYQNIAVPTEIIHGDADTIVPLTIHSQPLSQQIAGANLTVLPDIGHMPHHADPQAVADAIDRAASRAGLR